MEEKKEAAVVQSSNSKKKREDKVRKRDSRALENVLKTISSLPDEEKFQALCGKYAELYDEYRALQISDAAIEKRCSILQHEKDQLQSEQSKCLLARSRMESLCRELQRQNKLIKEENLVKIREEEERRKEVAAKFQATLNEITSVMNENSEKNIKLRDDNLSMANKIATICEQFEKREEELCRIGKQLQLERQLSEATLQKAHLELQAERELWNKEREDLQTKLAKSEETCGQLQINIKALEEHLLLYTGKYEEFESTINKSNRVFDNCKSEMLKMSKQIATLEKESKTWKMRWQKNVQSLLELSAAKQIQDAELAVAEKKSEQLRKLCRQLQVDRAAYLKLLKSNGIEPSSQICIDDVRTQNKSTAKEDESESLKNSLKVLEDKLSSMRKEINESVNSDKTEGEETVKNDETENVNNTAKEDESESLKNSIKVLEDKLCSMREDVNEPVNSDKTEGEQTSNSNTVENKTENTNSTVIKDESKNLKNEFKNLINNSMKALDENLDSIKKDVDSDKTESEETSNSNTVVNETENTNSTTNNGNDFEIAQGN